MLDASCTRNNPEINTRFTQLQYCLANGGNNSNHFFNLDSSLHARGSIVNRTALIAQIVAHGLIGLHLAKRQQHYFQLSTIGCLVIQIGKKNATAISL